MSFVTIYTRVQHHGTDQKGIGTISWDAAGYYSYLPGAFIYQDLTKMKWFYEVHHEHKLSGGYVYQFVPHENGNLVGKYFCGVSIMQMPFFLVAHGYAKATDHKSDGYSAPYQYGVAYAAIFYFLFGLVVLRKVLVSYFDELTTAITILLLALATNTLQYVSIEGGLSHAYIFFLYSLLLLYTHKWHESPARKYAIAIGLIIGFSMMCRPTEVVMFFIPLLWGVNNKNTLKAKLSLLKSNKSQLMFVFVFGVIGFLPQIIYWWVATGSPIHNVGSKWQFFNPWFRVLFGFQKGWFIYTPITVFFVIGFFFLKIHKFQQSVIWFCVLNIWIIISWHAWR